MHLRVFIVRAVVMPLIMIKVEILVTATGINFNF